MVIKILVVMESFIVSELI